jgi:hypothetical protein
VLPQSTYCGAEYTCAQVRRGAQDLHRASSPARSTSTRLKQVMTGKPAIVAEEMRSGFIYEIIGWLWIPDCCSDKAGHPEAADAEYLQLGNV